MVDVLPAGVTAHPVEGWSDDETAFHVTEHRALVFADAVVGAGDGRLKLALPEQGSGSADGERPERLRASLRRLLELPVEIVLPSHGEPVLTGGREALAAALDEPPLFGLRCPDRGELVAPDR